MTIGKKSNYVIRLLERWGEKRFSIFHFEKSVGGPGILGWLESADEIHTQGIIKISLSNGENQNVLGQIFFY